MKLDRYSQITQRSLKNLPLINIFKKILKKYWKTESGVSKINFAVPEIYCLELVKMFNINSDCTNSI